MSQVSKPPFGRLEWAEFPPPLPPPLPPELEFKELSSPLVIPCPRDKVDDDEVVDDDPSVKLSLFLFAGELKVWDAIAENDDDDDDE